MSGRLILGIANPALDPNGAVDAFSTLTYYENLTTTPQLIYADEALQTELTNPLPCDAAGRFPMVWAPDGSVYTVKWSPTGESDITWDYIFPEYSAPETSRTAVLSITVDGAGSAPSTGICGDLYVPFDCTIISNTVQATAAGDIVFDVWATPFVAAFPPTVANTICASAKPTLSSAQGSIDTTLTGWTKTLVAGTWVRFKIDSAATLTRATCQLIVTRT